MTDDDFDDDDPRTVVLYHAGCPDGWAAAWAAWKIAGDRADYIPVQYGREIPAAAFGARVVILDFSYPAADLVTLAGCSEGVTVLDHHLSAQAALSGLTAPGLSITFDMAKSGAVLAWEHFHAGEPVPEIIAFVQDRDLWAWELPRSREFSAALKSVPFEFAAWETLEAALADPVYRETFFQRGEAIVGHTDSIVKGLCDKAFTTRILGHSVPCVNSPSYQSEIGDELCGRHPEAPFSAIWFAPDMTSRIWSLRSRNGFDVSEVARVFGGGGHAAAASFRAGIDTNLSGRTVICVPVPVDDPDDDRDRDDEEDDDDDDIF